MEGQCRWVVSFQRLLAVERVLMSNATLTKGVGTPFSYPFQEKSPKRRPSTTISQTQQGAGHSRKR